MSAPLGPVLEQAIGVRAPLIDRLAAEDTDCFRVLHGVTEQRPGLAVDRYGPVLLVQTWREDALPEGLEAVRAQCTEALPGIELVLHRRRGEDGGVKEILDGDGAPVPLSALKGRSFEGREQGLRFDVRPIHRGQDPLLYLDLRAGRRAVRAAAEGRSVLNFFAYTCGIGIAAAAGGAKEVANIDFAGSALQVGRNNAALNGVPAGVFSTVKEDFFVVARQLAGLSIGARGRRSREFTKIKPRRFDLVVLDPPRWAKSKFGAVDVVRDYPSLLKPALLATEEGGAMLVTNHVPSVPLEDWLAILRRCAEKAERPIRDIRVIEPEEDFPSPDGKPPLKMAWLSV